ncbi:hypothetical protein ACFXPS_33410 [Nocardia sp. NPDC059091]|uniref:hypothetical protein n=1 Tax=unclassified Nocardia TaxID=2637762 RepID=UPI003673D52C
MAASFDLHTLAVLGAAGERLVIWHVNVGAALGESRLSGAWVLERSRAAEIESLTVGYPIVVAGNGAPASEAVGNDAQTAGTVGIRAQHAGTVGEGDQLADVVGVGAAAAGADGRNVGAAGIVDVDATIETIRAAIESADQRFVEHQDASGGKLTKPQWPVIAAPDEVALPQFQVDVADDHIRPVLTLARGLADLADSWAAFESLRLARPFLEDLGGAAARPLPLAVR